MRKLFIISGVTEGSDMVSYCLPRAVLHLERLIITRIQWCLSAATSFDVQKVLILLYVSILLQPRITSLCVWHV